MYILDCWDIFPLQITADVLPNLILLVQLLLGLEEREARQVFIFT
jgi:hypothetical protein